MTTSKKFSLKILVCVTALSLLNSCSTLSDHFAFMPDTKHILPAEQLPKDVDLITITTADNLKLQALYFAQSDSSKIILYFHGNAGNIYDRLDECGRLRELGFNVLLLSYRGYAQSQGRPTEAGVYTDAETALAYVTDNLAFSNENILVYGRSLGTAVSVHISQDKAIHKLVLITPMSSGNDLADAYVRGISFFLGKKIFDSMAKINNISCPILIVHGDADEVVPYEQGQKLFAHFSGYKQFVTIQGGGHNDLEYVDSNGYWSAISGFLAD